MSGIGSIYQTYFIYFMARYPDFCSTFVFFLIPIFYLCPQELQYLEEESHRTKASLQSRIKDREDEIQKLRNQVDPLTSSPSSPRCTSALFTNTPPLT